MDTIVSILLAVKNKLNGFGGRVQTLQTQLFQLIAKVAAVKTTAEQAVTDANAASTTATAANQTAANAATSAANAVTTANAASNTATAASTTATAASTTATAASTTANAAVTTANAASVMANDAASMATQAEEKANAADAKAEQLSIDLTNLDSDVIALGGRVNALEVGIKTGIGGFLLDMIQTNGTDVPLANYLAIVEADYNFGDTPLPPKQYLQQVITTDEYSNLVAGSFQLTIPNQPSITVNSSDIIVVNKNADGTMSYVGIQRNNASEWQKTVKDGFQALVDVLDANDIPLGNNQGTIQAALDAL